MYRLVDTGAWDDPWFSELTPSGKLLFLYLLTNRRTNSVGAYELTVRQVSFETGMPADEVERLLTEMHPKVQWWHEHNIVWVKNFYGRQNNGEKIEVNARRIVAELPPEIRTAVGMAYPTLSYKEDTPLIPYAYPMDKQNNNVTEQDLTETGLNTTKAPAAREKGYPPAFERFWTLVVRKEPSKAKAYEAWVKAIGRATDDTILLGLERVVPVWEQFDDQSKIPHITTWLNQDRWTVERPTGPSRASPASNGRATLQDFEDLMGGDIDEPTRDDQAAIDVAYAVSDGKTVGARGERDREGVGPGPRGRGL
jgi:hypothetical protein